MTKPDVTVTDKADNKYLSFLKARLLMESDCPSMKLMSHLPC